jgi:hypothetical protein
MSAVFSLEDLSASRRQFKRLGRQMRVGLRLWRRQVEIEDIYIGNKCVCFCLSVCLSLSLSPSLSLSLSLSLSPVVFPPDSGSWPPLTGFHDHIHWTHQTR